MAQPPPIAELRLDTDHLPQHHHTWWGAAWKLGSLVVALGLLILLWRYIQPHEAAVDQVVQSLGAWGPLLFIMAFIVCTALFFPESILAIAAGTIFGLWWGLLWVVLAGLCTAVLIHVLGRTVLKKPVKALLVRHPKIRVVDAAVAQRPLRLALLLRLAPVNFSLLNWLLSVSPIRFKVYLLSCVGMVPGNFSTVYMGFAARHTANLAQQVSTQGGLGPDDSLVHEVAMYLGLGAAIACSLLVARTAMVALRKAATIESSRQPAT